MNKQEIEKAINYIQNMDLSVFADKTEACKIVDMITDNLHQQLNDGWIPVSEGLPEVEGEYKVTVWYEIGGGINEIKKAFFFRGRWHIHLNHMGMGRAYRVTAWKPKDEPYKEVDLSE